MKDLVIIIVRSQPGGGGTAIYGLYIGMCRCEGYGFQAVCSSIGYINLAPVVQTVDNAIHRINHYPLDIAIGLALTYPVDSAIYRLNNWDRSVWV